MPAAELLELSTQIPACRRRFNCVPAFPFPESRLDQESCFYSFFNLAAISLFSSFSPKGGFPARPLLDIPALPSCHHAGDSPHADPAFLAKLARRKQMNYESMAIFAGAMAGLFFLFTFFHLLRRVGSELGASRRPNAVAGFFRTIRAACLQKFPGLPSGGHLIIITAYLAINVVVTFTNMDNQNMSLLSNVASRTGWMGIANLLIAIFLSLKNTPLAILTASSYERLNILHRVSGYATLVFVIVHSCAYAAMFGMQGSLKRLTEKDEIFGMVATGSFLVLAFAGAVVRTWWYELFYYLHVTFWILAIITTGLHQPEPSKKVIYATGVAAGIWGLERLVRFVRLLVCSINTR
ncbi:hypothetical protein NM208_g15023 [Fusarium decemcellulare]|uniref:Uncharacterized protein n=1 Tax=Fusarium decemcellulare TaxID=57161 RepID=A0ACC1RE94_9HYPO|nr:hypothetical protein NM208_g15023 [Fusarium decemcellulare]